MNVFILFFFGWEGEAASCQVRQLEIVSEQRQPFPALGKFGWALPITSNAALICSVGQKSPSAQKPASRHPRRGFS